MTSRPTGDSMRSLLEKRTESWLETKSSASRSKNPFKSRSSERTFKLSTIFDCPLILKEQDKCVSERWFKEGICNAVAIHVWKSEPIKSPSLSVNLPVRLMSLDD